MKKQTFEWQEIARRGRNHAVLVVSYIAESFRQRWVEKKMRWGFSPSSYRQFDGARWMHGSDVAGYQRAIARAEQKQPGYLLNKGQEYERLVKKIRAWGSNTSRLHFSQLSDSQLRKLFLQYVNLWMESNGFIYNYLFINDYLANDISQTLMKKQPDIVRQSKDLFTMLTPIKKSEARQEKEALVHLVQQVKKRMKIGSAKWHDAIAKHLDKFGHLNRYIYYGQSYTAQDITKRARELLSSDHLKRALRELYASAPDEKKINGLFTAYRFGRPTVLKIKAARWWSYVPTFWDETFIYHVHLLQPMFKEISTRLGLTYQQLIEMQYTEISDYLQYSRRATAAFKRKLKQRYQDSAVIFENGKIRLLTGVALKAYSRKEKSLEQTSGPAKIKELAGQAASPGKAAGRVSVVHSVNEVGKVKKGEVLVTSSTTPMHVPAMEKAVAIITDEGGLLSHAAIVSRELGVPCVVGTKIATKALKDGDRVEVDAMKGIVRKL